MFAWLRWGFWLVFNHVDAWGVALNAALVAALLHPPLTLPAVGTAVIIALTYLLGFAVNDYHDRHVDRDDPNKVGRNPFVLRDIPLRWAYAGFGVAIVLLAAGVLGYGLRGWLSVVVGVWALWAYSSPPLRLKAVPGVDLLMHVAFVETFPYALMLFYREYPVTWVDVVLLTLFGLGSLASQLEQQARDYAIDSRYEQNFTIRFGLAVNRRLMRAAVLMALMVGFTGLLTGGLPPIIWPYGLALLPLMLRRLLPAGKRQNWMSGKGLAYVTLGLVSAYTLWLLIGAEWVF
jgi:hypothetical protein